MCVFYAVGSIFFGYQLLVFGEFSDVWAQRNRKQFRAFVGTVPFATVFISLSVHYQIIKSKCLLYEKQKHQRQQNANKNNQIAFVLSFNKNNCKKFRIDKIALISKATKTKFK